MDQVPSTQEGPSSRPAWQAPDGMEQPQKGEEDAGERPMAWWQHLSPKIQKKIGVWDPKMNKKYMWQLIEYQAAREKWRADYRLWKAARRQAAAEEAEEAGGN